MHEVLEHTLHERLGLGVEGARGLVEYQDRAVGQYRAGDSDSLALAAEEFHVPLADHGVEAGRQPIHELERVGEACFLSDLPVGGIWAAVSDVLVDGAVEEQCPLRNAGDQPNLTHVPSSPSVGRGLHVLSPR